MIKYIIILGLSIFFVQNCSKKNIATEKKKINDSLKKNSIIQIKHNDNFSVKENNGIKVCSNDSVINVIGLSDAIKQNDKLYKEKINNSFILGDLIIIAYNEKKNIIAYLEYLPKISEDNQENAHIIIQDLNDNKTVVYEDYKFDNELNIEINAEFFYNKYHDKILGLLKKYQLLRKDNNIIFIPYTATKDKLKITTSNNDDEFNTINTVTIKSSNLEPKVFKNDNLFIKGSDSLNLYETDLLGELQINNKSNSIYIIGVLGRLIHSPNSIYLKIIKL